MTRNPFYTTDRDGTVLPRPYLSRYPDGSPRVEIVLLPLCRCHRPRGPANGVCGACGGAI